MDFGIAFGQHLNVVDVPLHAKAAEDAGFSHVTFVDMGNLANDVSVVMTVAALATERIQIGQGVTDPILHHPATIANAVATLRELSDDRAFVGIGLGGDYGKPYIRSATLAELREAIRFIRDYTAGEEASIGDHSWHNEWIRRSKYRGESARIMVAICGPKGCLLAGEADSAFSVGMDPTLQSWRKRLIERGAEEVGRDPGSVDVWVRTQIYVAESKAAAFYEVAPYAATCAWELWRVLRRKTPDTEELARELEAAHPGVLDELQAIYDHWDPYYAERQGGPQVACVTQQVVDLFLCSGEPEDVREQIGALEDIGVKGISTVTYAIEDPLAMMARIQSEIVPQFA
jgi:5,10-methylenetetrahydromethanopterin reductase